MRRVVRFRSLSSAYLAQLPPLSSTWQSVQLSPVAAAKNPIVSMNWSTGMPLRIWTFLKTSSAIGGLGSGPWAATTMAPRSHTSVIPLIALIGSDRDYHDDCRARLTSRAGSRAGRSEDRPLHSAPRSLFPALHRLSLERLRPELRE